MKIVLNIFIFLFVFGCGKNIEDVKTSNGYQSEDKESQNIEGLSDIDKQLKLAVENSSDNLVRFALKNGANPNKIFIGNETALSYSVKKDLNTIVRLLIVKGADPNQLNKLGEHPLHMSVSRVNLVTTNILLNDPRTNKNILDQYGNTPVISAISNGERRIALLLVSKKVDLTIKNANDELAEQIAAINFDEELGVLLTDLRKYQNPNNRFATVKEIISKQRKSSMLYMRSMYWDEKVELPAIIIKTALFLTDPIQRSFFLDSLFKLFKFDQTELDEMITFSAKLNDVESFKDLYQMSDTYNFNHLDEFDRTALTYAAENLDYQFAYYLRSKGADTYYEDSNKKIVNACRFIKRKGKRRRAVRNFKRLLGC